MQHSFLRHFDRINDKYGAWLFYIGLFLMIVCRYKFAVNKEMPELSFSLFYWVSQVGRFLLVIRILLFFHKYPYYVLCCFILFGIFWYSSGFSGWKILNSSIIITASRDANIRRILKIFLVAFLVLVCTAPTLWSIGWTGEVIKHKLGQIGHSFGFSNPNTLAFLLMMFTLLVLQFWNIKQTKVVWIICWSAALLVFLLTLGITDVVVLLLIPLLYYYLKHHPIPTWCLAFLPIICIIVSIILSCYYGPSCGETTFESRFSIPALIYQNHGLCLFGQEHVYVYPLASLSTKTQEIFVDNIYMHLILCNGVIIALIVFFFLSHYLLTIGKWGHPLLVASVIGITLSGMMENYPIDALANFLLLYYFQLSPSPSQYEQKVLDS